MTEQDRIKERASDAWDKTKGKTNEVVGKARGDMGQELKGKAQQAKGEIKEEYHDAKDALRRRERE